MLTVIYLVAVVSRGANAGGDAAHLAGMAAGAGYIWSARWRRKFWQQLSDKKRKKYQSQQRKLQFELDRILQKVHEHGIHSLSSREKRILKQATKQQQQNR
jgi:Skp family chaperone for outer membrane proteins